MTTLSNECRLVVTGIGLCITIAILGGCIGIWCSNASEGWYLAAGFAFFAGLGGFIGAIVNLGAMATDPEEKAETELKHEWNKPPPGQARNG